MILKQIKNKRGQAIVEYVLMLVVILTIFIALMKPFAEGLQELSNSAFKYYICLLTSGALPFDSGTNCSTDDFEYQPGDLSGGGGSGPGGSGNNSGTNNSPSPDNPYPNSQIPPPSSSNRGGSGIQMPVNIPGGDSSGGSGANSANSSSSGLPLSSSSGRLMSLNNSPSSSQTEGVRDGSGNKDKKLKFKTYPKGFSGYDSSYGGQLTAIHSSGSFSEEKEQKAKSTPIPASTAVKKDSSSETKKNNLLKIEERKKEIKDTKIKEWNFGSLLRIFLIVCFLIALIFIVGSQISQVQKALK